jgi:hypothetical protein
MRYILCEPIITTVSDMEISETEEIRGLFVGFKENQQSISIEFHDPDFPESVKTLDNARVTDIADSTFDLHAFFSHASARYRRIPYHNVKKVRIIAGKGAIAKKYKVSRWHLLDVADLAE